MIGAAIVTAGLKGLRMRLTVYYYLLYENTSNAKDARDWRNP